MPFISYTIFADCACTKFDRVINLSGDLATQLLRSWKDLKGSEPQEGDKLHGCRIDRIGSEADEEAA